MLKRKIEGWGQKWEEWRKRATYAVVFLSHVLCQNDYRCGGDVVVKTYERTHFFSNLCGSL